MAEIVEFDVAYSYSLLKVGIVVETVLRFGDLDVEIDARIDTGSTYCIFERQIGERLGLEITSGIPVPISTATGSFRVFGHRVEISVLGMRFDATVYFAESEYFNRNVLGRTGFLDRVKFGLVEPEGKVLLSRYLD